jgi:hypothetical protein
MGASLAFSHAVLLTHTVYLHTAKICVLETCNTAAVAGGTLCLFHIDRCQWTQQLFLRNSCPEPAVRGGVYCITHSGPPPSLRASQLLFFHQRLNWSASLDGQARGIDHPDVKAASTAFRALSPASLASLTTTAPQPVAPALAVAGGSVAGAAAAAGVCQVRRQPAAWHPQLTTVFVSLFKPSFKAPSGGVSPAVERQLHLLADSGCEVLCVWGGGADGGRRHAVRRARGQPGHGRARHRRHARAHRRSPDAVRTTAIKKLRIAI